MSQNIVQIDSFTDRPFAGNPAAVCLMEKPADPKWMLRVALEMNLSETAFLYPVDNGYHLRWFTPTTEVELCGHATLATAHLLFEDGHVPRDKTIRFQTLSGELTATFDKGWILLDFPAHPPRVIQPPPELVKIFGDSLVSVAALDTSLIAELVSDDAVRSFRPDFAAIAALPKGLLTVTAKSSRPPVDFVSRFFAPGLGIPEDPVTGYAHTVLGPFWMNKLGKSEFLAYQASARGGYIKVKVMGNRVILGGQAVTVMHGELT